MSHANSLKEIDLSLQMYGIQKYCTRSPRKKKRILAAHIVATLKAAKDDSLEFLGMPWCWGKRPPLLHEDMRNLSYTLPRYSINRRYQTL
jgi:hypothetical protein